MLFLTEDADAQRGLGNFGMALKRYHAVQRVFNEIEDDQYDFHGYSLRKFTVNIYLGYVTHVYLSLASRILAILFERVEHD